MKAHNDKGIRATRMGIETKKYRDTDKNKGTGLSSKHGREPNLIGWLATSKSNRASYHGTPNVVKYQPE